MFAFLLAAALSAAPAANPCAYDRPKTLALDQHAFDQQLGGGWRLLASKPQCESVAADLIRDYRRVHHSSDPTLLWHEGQLRADVGQTNDAIALFKRSYHSAADVKWNLYVDGTIAFLRHDRRALQNSRLRLAALPTPADWHPVGPDGKPLPITWPPNLNVLDGLLKCFDRPYEEAYGSACTEPIGKAENAKR